ncbi:venom serine carboxypeptidase-like [Babylonia areolata]|uniref:venom serine carboxypeptidase-like n=1 Tax=Babylonia areolata TaxID=304850 RepID=UPI003FD4D43A
MDISKMIPVLLLTLPALTQVTCLPISDDESIGNDVTGSDVTQHAGYSVAHTWASFIWNRFPAEFFPLFVSPLLETGRIAEAQSRSRVWNLSSDDVESYSGYITVNKKYNSNMFFWFFPAETLQSQAPVLLWVNGGPGRTSLVGALLENGPLEVNAEGTQLKRRAVSWTKHFSMLYVDNPVGVGYSFTKDKAGLSSSMKDVSENLYSVLVQFFQMFPQFSHQPFYVGGQSYAGKYVPSLGCYIHERNTDPQTPRKHIINFAGIYVGAGYCDPKHMMPVFPDFLYYTGLISNRLRLEMKKNFTNIVRERLERGKYRDTLDYLYEFFSRPSIIVGIDSVDNLLGEEETNDHLMEGLSRFMKSPATRLKLHVGFASNPRVLLFSEEAANKIHADILLDTSKENAFLMDHYKVLHYSGNLDVVVNVPMTEAFLDHVQWAGQEEYRQHERQIWRVNGELAGWFVTIRNFTRVIIRNSGHMAPYDQPERTLDMMKNFILDQPFRDE